MSVDIIDHIPDAKAKPLKAGRLKPRAEFRARVKGRRFILTTVQNNTKLHDKFWKTLTRMSKRLNAQLMVSKFSYNKNGWQRLTTDSTTIDGDEKLWYDARCEPYFILDQVKLADTLVFCAELDILPTTVDPFRGLDSYTGPNSAIIPHVKMQMKSLATMKDLPAKLLYSTGTVSQLNYIQRRAGQIAEYHHIFGATLVEVDADGDWFARQLNSDDNGIVYDLDTVWGPTWDKPAVDFGRPTINLGDIHIEKSDEVQMQGALDMLQELNPEKVFIHDLLDMESRNHHNLGDPHFLVGKLGHTVENDVRKAALWLDAMSLAFPTTEFYVIRSNHDEALGQWVRNGSKFLDPINLRYWHYLNYQKLKHIEIGQGFDLFAFALYEAGLRYDNPNVKFVQEDQSVLINGIEYGMHGHLGVNGSRASPKSFRQLGRRVNTGHTHSAGILDGVFTAGVVGSLDMGYNKGPSSWTCSSIVTYPNSKRTIVTQRGRKWRA